MTEVSIKVRDLEKVKAGALRPLECFEYDNNKYMVVGNFGINLLVIYLGERRVTRYLDGDTEVIPMNCKMELSYGN